jgi:general nucleoside transport system ATP-binding protein
MEDPTPVLELRGISKRFPGVLANDDVDFDLRRGEIHALLGENGAGKSTLMNILYGLYRPDAGEIRLRGRPVSFGSARDAIQAGIGMVHQHFMLIPVMTVAENVVLGTEPLRAGVLLDERAAEQRVADMARTFRFSVDPSALVEDIGVGQQQRVEIMKALYRNADILILDEPTAVLTPQEASDLFEILRTLRQEGISIIFISHKLKEVLEIADRITVVRRGRVIESIPAAGATQEGLARAMVGRDLLLRVEKGAANPGAAILTVENLHVLDDRELETVHGLSLEVKAGEIVGIAGIDGNGQSELVEAIVGLRRPTEGRILVSGKVITRDDPKHLIDAGIGHIPEDRHRRGLVLNFTVAENLSLHEYRRPTESRFGWLWPRRMITRAQKLIRDYDVRGGSPNTLAGSLSGGNQQKVVIAREIESEPEVLVAAQPTRGLDVGAIEYVHRRLVQARDAGKGVLLVSLELDEVRSLSDRILVLYEGRLVGEYTPEASEEELGLAMTGGTRGEEIPA